MFVYKQRKPPKATVPDLQLAQNGQTQYKTEHFCAFLNCAAAQKSFWTLFCLRDTQTRTTWNQWHCSSRCRLDQWLHWNAKSKVLDQMVNSVHTRVPCGMAPGFVHLHSFWSFGSQYEWWWVLDQRLPMCMHLGEVAECIYLQFGFLLLHQKRLPVQFHLHYYFCLLLRNVFSLGSAFLQLPKNSKASLRIPANLICFAS